MLIEDIGRGAGKAGRPGLDAMLASRDVTPVTFRDWRRIEEAEVQAAIEGAPREQFTSMDAMLAPIACSRGPRAPQRSAELPSCIRPLGWAHDCYAQRGFGSGDR